MGKDTEIWSRAAKKRRIMIQQCSIPEKAALFYSQLFIPTCSGIAACCMYGATLACCVKKWLVVLPLFPLQHRHYARTHRIVKEH